MKVEMPIIEGIEALTSDAEKGTLVAFGWDGGRKVPVAVAVVDMNVGNQADLRVLGEFIDNYSKCAF